MTLAVVLRDVSHDSRARLTSVDSLERGIVVTQNSAIRTTKGNKRPDVICHPTSQSRSLPDWRQELTSLLQEAVPQHREMVVKVRDRLALHDLGAQRSQLRSPHQP